MITPTSIGSARVATLSGVLISRDHRLTFNRGAGRVGKRNKQFRAHALLGVQQADDVAARLRALNHVVQVERRPDGVTLRVPALAAIIHVGADATRAESDTREGRLALRQVLLQDFVQI